MFTLKWFIFLIIIFISYLFLRIGQTGQGRSKITLEIIGNLSWIALLLSFFVLGWKEGAVLLLAVLLWAPIAEKIGISFLKKFK